MPADPMARQLSISYGGVLIGGAADNTYHLDGVHRLTRAFNQASVEFECTVVGTSEADFASKCTALEVAFTDPDHALIVSLGSQALLAFAAAPKDWCRPSIVKRGDPTDSGRSRTYSLRVDVDPAATMLSPSGLREATVDVAYSPARRRTVTVAGLWTAIDGDGSRDAYEAGIASYASTQLAALTGGGTFELIEEPTTAVDRPDHLISFRRVYQERLWEENGAALDDPDIIRQSAIFRRRRTAPGDSLGTSDTGNAQNNNPGSGSNTAEPAGATSVHRPTYVDVTYSAWVDKGTTDLVGTWDSIKSWLAGVVAADFAGANALTEETPSFDYDENRISATLVFMVLESGNVLEQTITMQTTANEDEVLVPAWTGKPYDAYAYDGPRILTRTVSLRAIFAGNMDEQQAIAYVKGKFQTGTSGIEDAGGGGWTRGTTQISTTRKRIGLETDSPVDVTEVQGSWTRRYFKRVTSSSGGSTTTPGGGGRAPVNTP
jgi:hypothetical protein